MTLSNEQFLPTRWIINKPSRKTLAEHVMKLRRIEHSLGSKFRYQCMYIGIWPVSFISGVTGERYKSQDWE